MMIETANMLADWNGCFAAKVVDKKEYLIQKSGAVDWKVIDFQF